MKQLHEGLDYRLYKIYIWGGLALLVVYLFVSTLVFEWASLPGPQATRRIFYPVMFYVAGILLYWWWVFLFKGNRELAELSQDQEQGVPAIKALRSWNTLHQAMAVGGGSVDEFIRNAKRADRPMLVWYGITNLAAVWIFAPFVLGSLEIIDLAGGAGAGLWLGGIGFWIVLMLVATPILAGWGGRSAEQAHLAPLGLALTRMPKLKPDVIGLIGGGQKLIPDGPAVVEGERYGRLVHIETIDRYSLTVLQARLPQFEVQSRDGKLVPRRGAPEAVVQAVKGLRKAKRWQGIVVHGGPEGIAIQRESKGTNMWLYDLWLAEHLLGEIDAG